MYKSLINFIMTKNLGCLSISDLYLWAKKIRLITKEVEKSGVFQIEDADGKLVFFGNAKENELETGICPLGYWPLGDQMSESDRKGLDAAYSTAKEFLQNTIQNVCIEHVDFENYCFKSSKWIVGNSAIWLYQDARDPMFGTEVAISIVKSSECEAY